MTHNEKWKEILLKVTIFCHPDDIAAPLIQKLINSYPYQVTRQESSSDLENIFILQLEIENWRITIYLHQPLGHHLIDKMPSHYYSGIAGSIILFSHNKDKSYQAARAFYTRFRKVNGDSPILVAFVEVYQGAQSPLLDEPEILEESPNTLYYGLNENDGKGLGKIIGAVVGRYMVFDKEKEKS
ncbi:MAG: hypothetical protein JSV04_12510 [Candidatus Heimdallarchaeota archaeon]|nr:MAG: hypothetical protein JSV04_12510 [Candidatus Heimdallarchaeota archaeon]